LRRKQKESLKNLAKKLKTSPVDIEQTTSGVGDDKKT